MNDISEAWNALMEVHAGILTGMIEHQKSLCQHRWVIANSNLALQCAKCNQVELPHAFGNLRPEWLKAKEEWEQQNHI